MFDDAPDVATAIAEMRLYDHKRRDAKPLPTTYSRTLASNAEKLDNAVGVLRASIEEPT